MKMGYKVVTIELDYSLWRGIWKKMRIRQEPIQVIFTWSKPKLEKRKRNQTVTSCILRQGIEAIGVGFAIENPNDEPNGVNGIHWAFKRAIKSMLHRKEFTLGETYSERFKKKVDKSFRQALWEATNGNS